MLFQKHIEPRCAYCLRGAQLEEGTILCRKHGVVAAGNHCPAFQYDPLKRTPAAPAPPDFSRLKDEDFVL